ncbi:MAG: SpoIIE family protein phosphatase, partial [Spirochaetia bacterium]|nr:SpoIIE family protein phosphatase [Spirochaetia bacterium]
FNADHPSAVLYRGGKASFLEETVFLMKLGSQIPGEFRLVETQLEPGDVLIVGSDGRDDINLTPGAEHRVINEDERLFLRLVEESGGDLKETVRRIQTKGELTDDISFIKITYTPGAAVMEPRPAPLTDLTELIRNKDYTFILSRSLLGTTATRNRSPPLPG